MTLKNTFFTFLCFLTLSTTVYTQGTWEYVHTGSSCSAQGSSGSCMQGRHEACYVEVGENFYLIGGRENNSNVNVYDPSNDSWTIGADAPYSIHHFQAVEYEGLIIILGAMTGNYPNETPIDKILIYDPLNDEWLDGPTIPVARRRGSSGVVVANEKIYLISGLTNGHISGWVPYMDEYNPKTNTWRILPDAPHSRDHFHAALADNKIYAGAGRRSGQDGVFDATEGAIDIFDLDTETWSTNARDIPTHRAAPSVAVIGNEVIYIGGEKESGDANNEAEALNINTGRWRTLSSLNTGRHGTQAIVNNENIWVAAGSPNRGGGTTKSQERFYFGSPANPILGTTSKSTLEAPTIYSVRNNTSSITLENKNGNQAILIENITLTGSVNRFSFNAGETLPFILKVGESLDVAITHSGNVNSTAKLNITHTGKNGSNSIDLNANEFTPDPNKVYYIDCPAQNARLASTGESEEPYTTSTNTTGNDVTWKFVAKGNGYWHIRRAAGGSKPGLRTDASSNADMQETSSNGVYTYYHFQASSTSGTYYATLPDGPSDYKRLQVDNSGDIKMVSDVFQGTWVSFKITEAALTSTVENIAPIGAVSQSSTAYGGSASKAVDKNTDGRFWNGSVTHTNNERRPHWQVEWNDLYEIDEIKIYNRTDCCTDRLSDFKVFVIDDISGNVTFTKEYSGEAGSILTVNTGGAKGNRVKIRLNGTNALSLTEVEVFGLATGNALARSSSEASFIQASKVDGRKVGLSWRVIDSKAPMLFEIEHSKEGGEFELIETLSADSNDERKIYDLSHKYPVDGQNTYRINVLFNDGSEYYLTSNSLSFEANKISKIFPNPSDGRLYVDLSDYQGKAVDLFLIDISGKVQMTQQLDGAHEPSVDLDLSVFQNGFYTLYIKAENNKPVVEKVSLINKY